MRGDGVRRIAFVLAFSLGLATVGVTAAGLATQSSAPSATVVVPLQLGVDAANVPAKLDGGSERAVSGRAAKQNSPLGAAVLVALAAIAVALAWWATQCAEGAARPQTLPRRSPQRAPPSLLLALS